MRGLIVAANQQPELAGVFTTFAADTPQVYLDIDRDKAQVLGVKVSDIFNALQATLGGYYVNDFNLFGRTWQVNIQAEDRFRDADRRHLPHLCPQRRRRDGADPGAGAGPAGAGAAGVDPLQRLPRRHHQRRAQARLQLGPGAGGDGAALGDDAAGRLRLRMDRHRAAGEGGGRPDRHRAGARRAVRLSLPGGALRELEHPAAGAAVGQRRRAGRHRLRVVAGARLRRLCPDRPGRAGGARRQERHPDRRVRRRAAAARRARSSIRRSRARGCASGR